MKILRFCLLAGLLLCATIPSHAQSIGDIISYQGKLTNADGTPVANGTKSVTFKIYENGNAVFTQTASVSTLGGVFSAFLEVGALKFDPSKQYQIGVTADGGETRHNIASVPVAQTAKAVIGPGNVPVGMINLWWSDGTVPEGWVVCDGSTVNNPASSLNGKTLPDLRDKFVRGVGNADVRSTPASGGSDTKQLTINEMPSHSHGVNDPGHNHNVHVWIGWGTAGPEASFGRVDANGGNPNQLWPTVSQPSTTGITIQSAGGGQPFSIVPAYVGLVYVMRIF